MENRKYNILFHLHTVSGIVISVVLFVIFFAGSFAFFRDDINSWQHNQSSANNEYLDIDIDKALIKLDSGYILQGRTFQLSRPFREQEFIAHLDPTKDSLADKKARIHEYFYVNPTTYKMKTYDQAYGLGEFLYRLHFLAQIPYPYGYYLAGFTALFFLFAIITGVLVHWKKIISNFYVFRPKEKLKTMWTDAHTALGMIGMPFQFVYAVTGAFFLINIFLVAPTVMTLYKGDDAKLYRELGYTNIEYEFANKRAPIAINFNEIAATAKKQFKDFNITMIEIQNYGDANMHVIAEGAIPRATKFTGIGKVIFDAKGNIVKKKDPYQTNSYLEGTKDVLYRIHYGDYAGYTLKIVSFVMGLLTCFVILSGVMLWLTARNKKNTDAKKKRFNNRVVRIYLAISMSMYPVTAAAFMAVKIYPEAEMNFLYAFYFTAWLLLTILLLLKKDYGFTTRFCLAAGSVLGFSIPITNGILTGNWFWMALDAGLFQVAFIDIFWNVLAIATLFAFLKSRTAKV
ncbi:MAG: PepSY domain-containing protein [Flavobacterium sp.]|uniref:PepSY-associated TM helix domain-containing protein n=1 Tax=Flavobacterium sp. TaxID=239 RepID=UPI0011FBEF14|nr:PepSY domain-containing protein [Flavobacterium sp.]RZJ68736.1 MAG: PepSY domain-containing protein [Flavobacterium sp.]